MLSLGDVLGKLEIDPSRTTVMRHVAEDQALKRHFGWLMRDRADLRNAYQSLQFSHRGTRGLASADWLVSCVGDKAGQAVVVGIDRVVGSRIVELADILSTDVFQTLRSLGTTWPTDEGQRIFYNLEGLTWDYAGKLVIGWPGGEINWVRRASKSLFPILAILPDVEASAPMPDWRDLRLTWAELRLLPEAWTRRLAEWRGIYFIRDTSTGRGYVGSAGGAENILARWRNYAGNGHGGNLGLVGVEAENLHFSILERTSPDLPQADLLAIENSWKVRLSTRTPHGNNRN